MVLATRDESDPESMTHYEKSRSNIEQVKARDGITEGDQLARKVSDHLLQIPHAPS